MCWVVWFRQLIKEMGFQAAGPVDIYEDNQGCLAMANNHRTDALTKHIDVKYHYTRDCIDESLIKIIYCPTDKMIADFLTKPINPTKFMWYRTQIGVKDVGLGGSVRDKPDPQH